MADPLVEDEENYASSEDSDFAPDTAPAAQDSEQSASEDEGDSKEPATKRRRIAGEADATDDAGYDNSGDEAIIEKGKKKQRRRKDKASAAADLDDDEGGEGGLIKTRRQRAAEKEEKRFAVNTGPVTINVDAVWAQMLAGQPTNATETNGASDAMDITEDGADTRLATAEVPSKSQPADAAEPSKMIRIKRTYNFAGRVHTEEKLVARDSAEAKLYFASQEGQDAAAAAGEEENDLPPRRAARKAFRSAFEPADLTLQRRADLNLGVAARMQAGRDAQQARKLNTVEKSRMDWAGYVDKEGIKDELELAGRSKGSYAARQDFLARSEARREEDARSARMAGRVS